MGIADRRQDFRGTDGAGSVKLTLDQDDPVPGGVPNLLHKTATSDVYRPLYIGYPALVQAKADRPRLPSAFALQMAASAAPALVK